MRGIIQYMCVNPEHQPARYAADPDVLYEGLRAYCSLGGDDGHDWRDIGGKTIETVAAPTGGRHRMTFGHPSRRARESQGRVHETTYLVKSD